MNYGFLYSMWMVGMCIACLGNKWPKNVLWEKGKLAEAVLWAGKCSAGKPWVLALMWLLL